MCGSFTKKEYHLNPGEYVAKWNGNSWQELAGGINSSAFSLFVHDDILYCHTLGDANINFLAGWDGHHWCGTPDQYSGGVPNGFGFIDDTLYSFYKNPKGTINGDSASYLNYFSGPNAICSTLGISIKEEGPEKSLELEIFPNPSGNGFSIIGFKPDEKYSIELINSFGSIIFQSENSTSRIFIETHNISSGTYFLKVDQQWIRKIIVY